MQGIREAGFTYCTPIQAQTLPLALSGRDVAGQAQTGTGKTAAFLVAMYQALLTRPAPANRNRTSILALIVALPALRLGGLALALATLCCTLLISAGTFSAKLGSTTPSTTFNWASF